MCFLNELRKQAAVSITRDVPGFSGKAWEIWVGLGFASTGLTQIVHMLVTISVLGMVRKLLRRHSPVSKTPS